MDINFELYKIFYHVAKTNSFSKAGKKLFISQSAVSQSIKSLEEKLGTSLFYRKTRSIKLTKDGELLFKHVEQAYNFLKGAENKIAEMQNLKSGEMRIGVGDTICKYFLIPYLSRFYNRYPNVHIRLINRTSTQITEILKSGFADFGIVTLPVEDKGIFFKEFMELEDIFVASSKFIELKNRKVTPQELSEYPLLLLEKASSTRRNIDEYFLSKGILLQPEIELESIDLLVEFAKIGLGIAHVLKESAAEAIEKEQLFEVELTEKPPVRKLGIVTMKDVPLCKAASEFIRMLQNSHSI